MCDKPLCFLLVEFINRQPKCSYHLLYTNVVYKRLYDQLKREPQLIEKTSKHKRQETINTKMSRISRNTTNHRFSGVKLVCLYWVLYFFFTSLGWRGRFVEATEYEMSEKTKKEFQKSVFGCYCNGVNGAYFDVADNILIIIPTRSSDLNRSKPQFILTTFEFCWCNLQFGFFHFWS